MNKRLTLHITSLLIIYALLFAPLLYTHSATLSNSLSLLICIFCFYCLGALVLFPSVLNGSLLAISHAAISVFTGALMYSMFLFLTADPSILLILLLILTGSLLFFFRRKIDWSIKPDPPGIFAFIICLFVMVIISKEDIIKQFTASQTGSTSFSTDNYFFYINCCLCSPREYFQRCL